MKIRVLVAMGAVLLLAGCSTSNSERSRLVTQADVINGGTPLTLAAIDRAVISDPADDFIPIELAAISLTARPLNTSMVIPANSAFSTFNVTSYDLTWSPGPNAPAALSDYNLTGGGIAATVPVNGQVVVSILVGTPAMKTEPWFTDLIGGGTPPFTARLEITFHGHDSGSERDVAVSTNTMVIFVPEVVN